MEKRAVTVRIPALGCERDFLIPAGMAVRDAIALMVRILASEYGVADSAAGAALFDMADGRMLRMECSLDQMGIPDGARLMLM